MSTKLRLSASVDEEVLTAAQAAVDAGRADTISAWVNEALRRQAAHDRRMQALDNFLEHYEAEHGVITEQEMLDAARSARERALVVRGPQRASRQPASKKLRTQKRKR